MQTRTAAALKFFGSRRRGNVDLIQFKIYADDRRMEIVMPLFTVKCRKDAYVDYVAEIEAKSAEEAAELAYSAPEEFDWEEDGVVEFDASLCVALDDDGNEIPGTETGKLSSGW